jgi:hypothetical protein
MPEREASIDREPETIWLDDANSKLIDELTIGDRATRSAIFRDYFMSALAHFGDMTVKRSGYAVKAANGRARLQFLGLIEIERLAPLFVDHLRQDKLDTFFEGRHHAEVELLNKFLPHYDRALSQGGDVELAIRLFQSAQSNGRLPVRERKRGRPPLGIRPMTPAERTRLWRQRAKASASSNG